jgi:protein SCO1/2
MIRFVLIGLGVIAVLIAAGVWMLTQPYTFRGSVIEPAMRAPDISLAAHNSKTFKLSDQADNVVLLVFGYTHCPDVCPTTLAEFKKIRAELGTRAQRVRFVFITIDPERDTLEHLRGYLSIFDPAILGLSGAEAELEPVWKNYGVYRAKRDVGSAAGYLMDHSSRIYAIDRRGNLRVTFAYGTEVRDIVADVRYLVDEAK